MKNSLPGLLAICTALALAACAHRADTKSVEQRFNNYDLDSDGRITQEEYGEAATRIIFASFDADENGNVTLAEWQALEGETSDSIYKRHDSDDDGKVTLDEALARTRKTMPFANDFPGIDTNKDGFVVLSEAQAYASRWRAAVR